MSRLDSPREMARSASKTVCSSSANRSLLASSVPPTSRSAESRLCRSVRTSPSSAHSSSEMAHTCASTAALSRPAASSCSRSMHTFCGRKASDLPRALKRSSNAPTCLRKALTHACFASADGAAKTLAFRPTHSSNACRAKPTAATTETAVPSASFVSSGSVASPRARTRALARESASLTVCLPSMPGVEMSSTSLNMMRRTALPVPAPVTPAQALAPSALGGGSSCAVPSLTKRLCGCASPPGKTAERSSRPSSFEIAATFAHDSASAADSLTAVHSSATLSSTSCSCANSGAAGSVSCSIRSTSILYRGTRCMGCMSNESTAHPAFPSASLITLPTAPPPSLAFPSAA
mmetsp:Transcript_41395/g.102129  ORF Transcript_41395/g.102129 Transcript_41395/m.102129 type:complete len:350 (-) Transcript_41395:856-1905(-)